MSLTCAVLDSAATEELLWFRNEQKVSLKDGNRLNTSHVCVQPVTRDDNGVVFTCQLKADASVKAAVRLEVQCEYELRVPPLFHSIMFKLTCLVRS